MRILIVEDEHKIANALKRGLEHEAFAVDVAYDSDEGLSYATTETYDAIILDRMLPGERDGIAVCEEIRAKKIHTPILMLTARDQVSDRVAGLNAGADDYLIKPFAFEELLARLYALMRRPQATQDTTLKVDDLTLNPVTFEVQRGDKYINLSRKEFSLLQFLMRNSGIVVSKDSIISHVWNFDADILPNTVEVYMGYLRQKIDKPFPDSADLIQTVRGFGYRLGQRQ
ncbi:MAG: ykoG [Candidatus Saccharibacteria bacterium]|nr:ykoG [Candidatus Saccharibacteria bacterium]